MRHFVSHAEVRRYCANGKIEDVSAEITDRQWQIDRLEEEVKMCHDAMDAAIEELALFWEREGVSPEESYALTALNVARYRRLRND